MIKYNLKINDFGYPNIIFGKKYEYDNNTQDWTCLSEEITNISGKYLEIIVQELKEVVAGTREKCIFGFETSGFWVYQKGKGYYGKLYPNSEVTITYDYGDKELITDLKAQEILKMMTEWREYINAWEKETGKIKN